MAEQWPNAARPRPESERALVSRRTRQAVPCCLPYSSPFSAAHGREMLRQPCPASCRPAPGRLPLFSPRLKCAAFRVPRGSPHCLPPALCPVRAICSLARIPLGIAPFVPPKMPTGARQRRAGLCNAAVLGAFFCVLRPSAHASAAPSPPVVRGQGRGLCDRVFGKRLLPVHGRLHFPPGRRGAQHRLASHWRGCRCCRMTLGKGDTACRTGNRRLWRDAPHRGCPRRRHRPAVRPQASSLGLSCSAAPVSGRDKASGAQCMRSSSWCNSSALE